MEYYLQDTRSYVGNCVLWWKKDGNGYTTNIAEAHIYSTDDLFNKTFRETDKFWPKEEIDRLAYKTFDMQLFNQVKNGPTL